MTDSEAEPNTDPADLPTEGGVEVQVGGASASRAFSGSALAAALAWFIVVVL